MKHKRRAIFIAPLVLVAIAAGCGTTPPSTPEAPTSPGPAQTTNTITSPNIPANRVDEASRIIEESFTEQYNKKLKIRFPSGSAPTVAEINCDLFPTDPIYSPDITTFNCVYTVSDGVRSEIWEVEVIVQPNGTWRTRDNGTQIR